MTRMQAEQQAFDLGKKDKNSTYYAVSNFPESLTAWEVTKQSKGKSK
jgi:hypothetical protein